MIRRSLETLCLLAPLLAPAVASALSTDKDQPLYIEANQADIDDRKGVSVYRGNVQLTRGSMRLNAETLTVYSTAGEIRRAVAEGDPARYRQLQDRNQQEVRAQARHMEYHADSGVLVLTDQARLWQSDNEFTSNRIEYDSAREAVTAGTVDSDKQRVRIKIQPKRETPAPTPPTSEAQPAAPE